jgi:hypothetical protein
MDMDMDMANIAMTKLLKLKDELKEGNKTLFLSNFSVYLLDDFFLKSECGRELPDLYVITQFFGIFSSNF